MTPMRRTEDQAAAMAGVADAVAAVQSPREPWEVAALDQRIQEWRDGLYGLGLDPYSPDVSDTIVATTFITAARASEWAEQGTQRPMAAALGEAAQVGLELRGTARRQVTTRQAGGVLSALAVGAVALVVSLLGQMAPLPAQASAQPPPAYVAPTLPPATPPPPRPAETRLDRRPARPPPPPTVAVVLPPLPLLAPLSAPPPPGAPPLAVPPPVAPPPAAQVCLLGTCVSVLGPDGVLTIDRPSGNLARRHLARRPSSGPPAGRPR